MKTTDLRLGNLISFKALNPNDEAIEHRGIVTVITQNSVFMGDALHIPIELVVPIPLTEEILLEAGFEPQDDSEMWSLQVGNTLYLEYHPKFKQFALTPESWRGETSVWMWNDPQYVHQLQNLIFSLTGEELTLSI